MDGYQWMTGEVSFYFIFIVYMNVITKNLINLVKVVSKQEGACNVSSTLGLMYHVE